MKTQKGFLLIELMVSFTILSIMLCACGHFFVYTSKAYQSARSRLRSMQSVQNNIESFWLQQTPFEDTAQMINLLLPQAGIHLPDVGTHLVYAAFQITHETGTSIIPGYVYEK